MKYMCKYMYVYYFSIKCKQQQQQQSVKRFICARSSIWCRVELVAVENLSKKKRKRWKLIYVLKNTRKTFRAQKWKNEVSVKLANRNCRRTDNSCYAERVVKAGNTIFLVQQCRRRRSKQDLLKRIKHSGGTITVVKREKNPVEQRSSGIR